MKGRWEVQTSPWDTFHKGCKDLCQPDTVAHAMSPNEECPLYSQRCLFLWWPWRSWLILKSQGKKKHQVYMQRWLEEAYLTWTLLSDTRFWRNITFPFKFQCIWHMPKSRTLLVLSGSLLTKFIYYRYWYLWRYGSSRPCFQCVL